MTSRAAADGADRVGAGPAEQAVAAEAAVELVAPWPPRSDVVAAPALELVVAVAAGEASLPVRPKSESSPAPP